MVAIKCQKELRTSASDLPGHAWQAGMQVQCLHRDRAGLPGARRSLEEMSWLSTRSCDGFLCIGG